MAGLKALDQLLTGMQPVLYPGDHGYATLANGAVPPALATFAVIAEDEGLTLVALSADLAAVAIAHLGGWARISLTVHSDLAAVGLTAAIVRALSEAGISANVIAGCFHDHIFVQSTMAAQQNLQAGRAA